MTEANHELSRLEMLKHFKTIRPAVIEATLTNDMGIECSIATQEGIIYARPGMMLFAGGNWPVAKLSPSDPGYVKGVTTYSLHTGDDPTLFADIKKLEAAFVDLFEVDAKWEDLPSDELTDWYEIVSSTGYTITSLIEDQ